MRPLVKHHKPCVHSWREDSTLRLGTVSAVGKSMYRVYCKECGVSTTICLTTQEAQERARVGWLS